MLKRRHGYIRSRTVWPAIFILILLSSVGISEASIYYSLNMQSQTTVSSPDVTLQDGSAGTSTIYTNSTSAKTSVEAPLLDYVDDNDYDVDSSADKGQHSNFTAQQAGPDSIYDTLSEGTRPVIEDYVDNEDIDMDGSADQGTLTDFANLMAYDSNYANFSETAGEVSEYSVDLTGDYLISDSADMTSGTGTIEMWVQFDAVSGRFYGLDGDMEIRYSAGWLFDWGGTGSMTSSHTPSVATWYHYSWTWDETANDLFFYVGTESTAPSLDAGSPASGGWTGTVSTISFTDVYIGNGKGGAGIIDGHFDDVRYWSDVRTLTEIQDNYKKTLEGNEAGLVNYWELENDLTDSAGTDDLTTSGASYAFSTDVPSNWESVTNYQFDHEVQFTTVIDFLLIEKLCIYAGSFGGSEDINVTYWGGSSWSSITSDLTASSWNNYTVSLTSANFTIKFGGSNTNGDGVQDYWLIDAVLLQVSGAGSSEIAVDNDTSDVDTSDDEGSLTDFSYMKAYNSSYANFTETISGGDIQFVNSTEAIAVSGDLVISVPDGVQDGDFMISFLGHSDDDPAVTLTPASGWNLQRGKTDMGTRATSPPVIWIYYRVAASEPSSYTWQFDTAGARIGFCLAYRNVDSIDIDSLNAQTSTGGTAISPDISTNNDGDWIISFVWHDDDDPPDMTAPSDSGFTVRHDAQDATGGNGFGMGVGDELRATQGSTGTRTWTLTALEERSGIMLSINASGTGNYTLDQEVQFTNVPTILPNATLCIYANSTDAEDITVDVWNVTGSSWHEVFSDLTASAWNNVSIVDYLTSENFTVRFRDGSPTGDTTTQDTWLINVALIHIWNGIEANYQLDIEVQWTSAAYTWTNEELCIRTGTFSGSEDIQVKIWNTTGSSWHWIMNLTASQWNNVSISSYLTSNTFTVQFLGGAETGDTNQDSWNIDATILHLWSSESTYDYADNNTSDAGSPADIGTHSNFTAQQSGPDLINDTLTEGGGGTVWLWQEDTSGYTAIGSYETFEFWNSWTTNATTSGSVTKLGIYVFANPGNSPQVKLGIYDDNGGSPNNLLGETNAATITSAGWLDLDIVGGGVSISASTTYHIAHITDIAPTTQWRYYKTATPVSDYRNNRVWPNLFDPAGATTKSSSYRYGAYRVGYDESYRLDLEVQWTSVDYGQGETDLCIYGGSMPSEDLLVDFWNGTGWQNVLTDLTANSWNNVSVSSYLNSSTFTIRFKDSNEISDTNQDSWNIDATLLHVWTSGVTFDYVLRVNNTGTDAWQIRLKEYADSNITRLQNCTVYFYNSTDGISRQIYIQDGLYVNQTGPWYDLGVSETIYIAMTVEATSSETSYIRAYLEIRKPGTTTYLQYIVTFEIT